MNYTIPQHINPCKMFIIHRSELEGRIEPEYYRPEIADIERTIRGKSNKKLKDFIQKMASGATPSVQEEEKYYSDADIGIPFLRVQNLQTNGHLDLEDVKYINLETHNKYLKRSQVKEHNLLVKITGVGRMAIASVAPDNFIGNTNQHMVVIKTVNRQTSNYLATYLNLDIVEKLASRRSTGGTRPALDYPALRSIPIIEGLDFSVLAEAELKKQQKEDEARLLLQSIDAYLLNELGIILPKKESSLQSRMFTTAFSELTGGRLDANYYSSEFEILDILPNKFQFLKLNKICSRISDAPHERPDFSDDSTGIKVVLIEHLKPDGIEDKNPQFISEQYHQKLKSTHLKKDDLLMARIGVTTGTTSIVDDRFVGMNISGNITLIRINSPMVSNKFVLEYINSSIGKLQIKRILSNSARDFLTVAKIKSFLIPIITLEKQNEIAAHIANIRNRARQLQLEAIKILQTAKAEVEKQILG